MTQLRSYPADVKVGDRLPLVSIELTRSLIVYGALASRDWQPQHHDPDFARDRNGMSDVFVNTPHNAAFIERYVTDWTGPLGRLAKLRFRMLRPAYPGDVVKLSGRVTAVVPSAAGCSWVDIAIESEVDGETGLAGAVRVSVPCSPEANPWSIAASSWDPEFGAVVID